MKYSIVLSLMIIFGFVACTSAQKSNVAIAENISVEEFASKINSFTDEQVVDIRTPSEWSNGVMKGASKIDYYNNNFESECSKLNKNVPIMIYCRSGKRGGSAMKVLKDLGFNEIYNLSGGMMAWQNSGNEIVD